MSAFFFSPWLALLVFLTLSILACSWSAYWLALSWTLKMFLYSWHLQRYCLGLAWYWTGKPSVYRQGFCFHSRHWLSPEISRKTSCFGQEEHLAHRIAQFPVIRFSCRRLAEWWQYQPCIYLWHHCLDWACRQSCLSILVRSRFQSSKGCWWWPFPVPFQRPDQSPYLRHRKFWLSLDILSLLCSFSSFLFWRKIVKLSFLSCSP